MDVTTTAEDGTIIHTYWCIYCTQWFFENRGECLGPGELADENWFPENYSNIQEGMANRWPLEKIAN